MKTGPWKASKRGNNSIASHDLELNKNIYVILKKFPFFFCKFPTDYICKLNLAVHDLGVPASESQNLGAFWCVLFTYFGAPFLFTISILEWLQGVLALCEFHYCEFGYCGFSKLLLKICLMRFLCTITLVNADISYRYMPNAIFG